MTRNLYGTEAKTEHQNKSFDIIIVEIKSTMRNKGAQLKTFCTFRTRLDVNCILSMSWKNNSYIKIQTEKSLIHTSICTLIDVYWWVLIGMAIVNYETLSSHQSYNCVRHTLRKLVFSFCKKSIVFVVIVSSQNFNATITNLNTFTFHLIFQNHNEHTHRNARVNALSINFQLECLWNGGFIPVLPRILLRVR